MSSLRMQSARQIYEAIIKAQADIDAHGGPQLATAWHELNTAKNILRVAIDGAPPIEIQEAA